VELVVCALIFQQNILPPTINQQERDPLCDLDYIPNVAREKKVDTVLKTSSGFSGIHSTLILKRFKG
ncbi:MAG: hypothetical protein NC829_00820, partial [Candidatus Omnitrophica bacterium]|nr:hypothetical protein [Candidatus Omnitrophota bacterium]